MGGSAVSLKNGSKNRKTLIPLDFSNPELHNKLLAHRIQTWDDVELANAIFRPIQAVTFAPGTMSQRIFS